MKEGTTSQGSAGPGTGRVWAEYELCGFRFRLTEPELKFREEGDQTFCRVEFGMQTIPPGSRRKAR